MTQWEQIKNEYRELPVPEGGRQQMLQAMADAKQKRNRRKRLTGYGTVVAAALLVVLLGPGMRLFSGGFASMNDSAVLEKDCAAESATADGAWFSQSKADTMAPVTDSTAAEVPATGYLPTNAPEEAFEEATGNSSTMQPGTPEYGLDGNAGNTSDAVNFGEELKAEAPQRFSAEEVETISGEIRRQMEQRMQETGGTYYIKGEEYPDGFEKIAEDQAYYVNADGLLVIVFPAGEVAPKEQGSVEFIIPAEVAAP